ncbi:MAG: efflux RND transporter periplasmic adaptor subunit [Terriglobales bacterium]
MATQRPAFAVPLTEFAAALLAEREVIPRARITAQQIADLFPKSGVVVYTLEEGVEGKQWSPKSTLEISLQDPFVAYEEGTLGAMAEQNAAVIFSGSDLAREAYAHLNVRATVASIATVPLSVNEQLIGAIEIVSFKEAITEEGVAALAQLTEYASIGIASAISYENERNANFEAISRLTQLYDFEKVVNSLLELDQVMALVASKTQELMNVQAVNLWMHHGDELLLVQRQGLDETVEVGATQKGEGIASEVARKGEPLLIDDPEDQRLKARNASLTDPRPEAGAIYSLVAMPLLERESQVGVIELINKLDSTVFDEDDLFFLSTIAEAAAGALHNASLLEAERKVEYLETLVKVSHEITGTLNLDRVVQTVVNQPQAVIPYERAAIALEKHGKLSLKAISGVERFVPGEATVSTLQDILEWVAGTNDEVYITQRDGEINTKREETRAKFNKYFASTGMRSFYALPLVDDQGRVGIYSLESSDPDFLNEAQLELIKIIAGQATVALRNADMYKEVPFIGILEPVLRKKNQFLQMERAKQKTYAIGAAVGALLLVLIQIPMRVDGAATVAPGRVSQIQAEVEGTVKKVYVKEGQQVKAAEVLADLDDWDYRASLAAAEAKLNTSSSAMNQALASNNGTEAGVQKIQTDFWRAEVARARERLERTHLRAPISGVVSTPHIQSFAGKHLAVGDSFAEISDTSQATVDVAVDETDVALLNHPKKPMPASVKLDGFPASTFKGTVDIVSPKSETAGDHRVYFARVTVANPEGEMRPGMQGRAKVNTGWRPLGYVLLRRPAMWIWSLLWNWFGI